MADEGATQEPNRLSTLLTTVGAALGVLVSVTALNVDRSWRITALAVGLLGFVVVLVARLPRLATRAFQAAGITLIVVAGLVLVVSPAPSTPGPPEPKARISLSQLLVTDSTAGRPVALDITVHNLGDRLAVLTGVKLKILDFAYLRTCYTQGEVGASKPYPVTLPDRPTADATVTIPLHEEVGRDEVDRFVVQLRPPPYRAPEGYPEEGVFGYRVAISLSSDVQGDLTLGGAAFAVPGTPGLWTSVWDPTDPDRKAKMSNAVNSGTPLTWGGEYMHGVETCMSKNAKSVLRLLRPAGARSTAMAELLSAIDPDE
jgi:hypothetical protein